MALRLRPYVPPFFVSLKLSRGGSLLSVGVVLLLLFVLLLFVLLFGADEELLVVSAAVVSAAGGTKRFPVDLSPDPYGCTPISKFKVERDSRY